MRFLSASPSSSEANPTTNCAGPLNVCPAVRTPAGARRGSRGFTLLEVLLSLAIIALVASVLVGGAAHLLTDKPLTLEEVFWKAVQESRKQALKSEHEMRLKFDAKNKQFILIDGMAPAGLAADGFTREEVPVKVFPVSTTAAADLSVDFLSATKGGSTVLIGGMLLESQPIATVTFYADGTCTPFRVQFARNGGTQTLGVDPWTCAPVLDNKETR